MGYDERQQANSSGTLVAVIGVGLVLAILAIMAVAGVGLFWVRASTQQGIVMEQRAIADAHRAEAEANLSRATAQMEQPGVATTPDPRLNFVLGIDREGNLSVDGEKIESDELRTRLIELKDETSNAFSVHINADSECPVKHIVPVLDVCDEVGDIDFSIASSHESHSHSDDALSQ